MMRTPTSAILFVLVLFLPAAAEATRTRHLLATDPGPHVRIVAVDPAAAAGDRVRFDEAGGRIDAATGVVLGRSVTGEAARVPLATVARLTVSYAEGGREQEYSATAEALRGDADWPPAGRIERALLTAGVWLEFDGAAPGVDLAGGTLFWSLGDTAATSIPFADIVFVEIVHNRFVRDFNDLADVALVGAVRTDAGEVVAAGGETAVIDAGAGVLRRGERTLPLASLRRIEIVDSRRIRSAEAPVLFPEPEVAAAGSSETLWEPQPGQRVRIKTPDRRRDRIKGTIVDWSDEQLAVLEDGDTLAVDRSEIERFEVSRGTGDAANTGALAGAIFGVAVGAGIGSAFANNDFFETGSGPIYLGGGVGAVLGVLVGTVIGSGVTTEEWEERTLAPTVAVGLGGRPGLAVAWRF